MKPFWGIYSLLWILVSLPYEFNLASFDKIHEKTGKPVTIHRNTCQACHDRASHVKFLARLWQDLGKANMIFSLGHP